ncbi:MAG TPA: hypothetical protein VN802_20965 [Stellaceae bacterium]|nr:hypothetical protein [Stellaceae bacterium]
MLRLSMAAAILVLALGPASAATQVKVPGCDVIDAWAARVNMADTYNVAPRLTLPKAFQDSDLVPM